MKNVIIIGAGPAGLTAAYELLERGGAEYAVTVLEESQAFGGISRTVRHNGNRMDIGGHRFFSKDDRVVDWWEKFMPLQGAPSMDDRILGRDVPLKAGGPDPEACDEVMLTRRRVSRIYYHKKFFDYPVRMNANTIRNMGLATTMEAGMSYLAATAHKRPEDSLENFYINRFGKKLYSMFFESYTEKLWGRHPREISAAWGAQRVKGLSIRAILADMLRKLRPGKGDKSKVETSLIEEFSYPKYGPGQLWETVAERARQLGADIRLGCRVTGLDVEDGRVKSVRYEEGGVERAQAADIVISSMPIKDLVLGIPGAPEDMRRIAAGLPYRDFVTVGLLVPRLELKNETDMKTLGNIVPDCWIYVQDAHVRLGRIQIFNNWSPYMVKDPEHTVWIGLEYFCAEGDKYWNMSEAEWIDMGKRELVSMGVLSSAETVLDAHQERVKKAYPAYFDTYDEMDKLRTWLDGFANLYCVGRNGQHRYNNMDHSMVTAFEAVGNILSGAQSKDNVWNVNTEQSYHESREAK